MLKKSNLFQKIGELLTFRKKSIYRETSFMIRGELYRIREIHNKDIKELLSVEREAFNDLPWDRGAFLFELNALYPRLYLLVEVDGKVVGFIGCRFKDLNGHITNLAVRKAYQEHGIGSRLIGEIQRYALKYEYETMSLEVRVSNMDAQRLYRKFGFVSRSIKKRYYTKGNEDALDMLCVLKGK